MSSKPVWLCYDYTSLVAQWLRHLHNVFTECLGFNSPAHNLHTDRLFIAPTGAAIGIFWQKLMFKHACLLYQLTIEHPNNIDQVFKTRSASTNFYKLFRDACSTAWSLMQHFLAYQGETVLCVWTRVSDKTSIAQIRAHKLRLIKKTLLKINKNSYIQKASESSSQNMAPLNWRNGSEVILKSLLFQTNLGASLGLSFSSSAAGPTTLIFTPASPMILINHKISSLSW